YLELSFIWRLLLYLESRWSPSSGLVRTTWRGQTGQFSIQFCQLVNSLLTGDLRTRKAYVRKAKHRLATHPGERVRIDDVAQLTRGAFLDKFNPLNITAGFRSSGIWPFNRHVFSDDFLLSQVTDRPIVLIAAPVVATT
ncbi:Uncharacterized protein APZ42_027814, partial [Daphnia magna]